MNDYDRMCEDVPEEGTVCEWYALCTRPATVYVPHPILTRVPTCAECAARVEREKERNRP